MVSIFVGSGSGYARGSGNIVGGAGLLGSGAQGRGGDNVSVNAATGNLLISREDEFLVGRGPDASISRTYNSLAQMSDGDNGDQWQQSTMRRVFGLTGTLGAAGSTVSRQGADGSVIVYSWKSIGGVAAYWTTDGDGAHDKLEKTTSPNGWTWTDGSSRWTETYEALASDATMFRLKQQKDTDGNALTFSYVGDGFKLDQVATANHGGGTQSYVKYVWDTLKPDNLARIETYYTDFGDPSTTADDAPRMLTRARYAYDASNRLITATVDLSPGDNSIADGKAYVTTYTYDGTSDRVASITQTDGSSLAIAYDASGRVATLTQAVAGSDTRVTSLSYGISHTSITGPDGQTTRLDYAGGNLSPQSILDWGSNPEYIGKELIDPIDGAVAGKFTSVPGATWSGISISLAPVVAGDVIRFSVSLQAVAGHATTQELGLNGSASDWGTSGSSARILSGPGTLVQAGGGRWRIVGLSATEPTRIEITRTYTQSETARAYIYVDRPGGYVDGQQLIVAGAMTTKNAVNDGSLLQLTKITAPPVYSGATAQSIQFGYDTAGNLTSVTDTAGKVTVYAYDGNGNVLTSTDPNGNVVTRTYGTKNELLTETRTVSVAGAAPASATTRYIYDAENHLRYAVSAENRVTEYIYSASGAHIRTIEYPSHPFTLGSGSFTETDVNAWRDGLVDRSTIERLVLNYDGRDNLVSQLAYSGSNADGTATNAEGYIHTNLVYDQAGKLLSRTVATQNSESFVYDGLGRLIASTDLGGGTTTIVFSDTALTTTVTTGTGFTTLSSFNKAGDLVGEMHGGSYDVAGSEGYLYDKNGRLRVATDAVGGKTYYLYDKAGRKIADINHYGHITEYRYDAAGRVAVSVSNYNKALSADQIAALGDPDNMLEMADIRPPAHASDIWNWSIYDDGGRLIESIDGVGGVTAYGYDASDRLMKTVRYHNQLSGSQLTAFKAAAPTAPVLPVTDSAKDVIVRRFYDADGLLIGALDGEGYLTEIVNDAAGRKVEEIAYAAKTSSSHWASGSFGQLRQSALQVSNASRRNHYVYDGQGLLRYAVDGGGHVAEYIYKSDVAWGAVGLVRATIRHATTISTSDFSYSNVKTLVEANAANSANRRDWAIYDMSGRIAYAVNAAGAVTAFSYDVAGNVVKTVEFAYTRETSSLPTLADMSSWAAARINVSGNRIARNWYTAAGALRFAVDAEGYVTRYDYDAAGQLKREVHWDNRVSVSDTTTISQVDTMTGAAGDWADVRYYYDSAGRFNGSYDGEGNRTHEAWYVSGAKSYVTHGFGTADASQTVYANDATGRKIADYFAFEEAEQSVVQYAYDGTGNLTSVTDARGKVTSYTYDRRGLVLTMTDAAGGVTVYEYNAFGEVVKVRNANGGETYSYYDDLGRTTMVRDAMNFVTRKTYTAFGEAETVTRYYNPTGSSTSTITPPTVSTHAKDATTSFEYNKQGLVTKTTDAEGFFETYGYDAFGNRTSVVAKSKDANKVAGGTTVYVYDKRGLLLSETLPVSSHNADGSVQGTIVNTYSYDARGNRIEMVEAAGLAEARTTTYEYDKANRLKKTIGQTFQGLTPEEVLTYDARGNVTSRTDAAGARTVYYYDDLDRVVATIDAAGAYTSNAYDGNGNLVSAKVYSTAVTVPADGGSEEEAPVPTGSVRVTTFTYDNLNRLETSSVTGVATGSWNESTWVANVTGSPPVPAAITTVYQYDANGNVTKATDANGGATWNYYDKLGHKTHQVDAAGYLTVWTYDGEGNVLTETRYANPAAAPAGTVVPPSVTANAALDRVTTFTYDKNGNRLSEARSGVLVFDPATGGTTSTTVTVRWLYNGLGQVVRKTEATALDGPAAQTARLYLVALGRLPTQTEVGNWSYRLLVEHGNKANPFVEIASEILGDAGVAARLNPSNQTTFIDNLYQYAMGRTPTTGERDAWLANMSNGWTIGRVLAFFVDHAENRARTDASVTGLIDSLNAADATNYSYDAGGRLIQEKRAAFFNQQGASVTPTVDYYYNGFGDLALTRAAAGDTLERATTYSYDGGKLISITDATGFVRRYKYDIAGRITHDYYTRLKSDGTAAYDYEGTLTSYDMLGRAAEQWQATSANATSWTAASPVLSTRYNAFGEVSQTGLNAAGIAETSKLWQTQNYYDGAGRLWKSNAGDGVWKLFGYDKNGNQTIAISNAGENLAGLTFDAAFAKVGEADVNGTYTAYDKRNMVTSVVDGGRELGAGITGAIVTSRSYNAFGELLTETATHLSDDTTPLAVTTYSCNKIGRVTRIEGPVVQMTRENGTTLWIRASQDNYYDRSGRLVATRDANGSYADNANNSETNPATKAADTGGLTRLTLLAGTGYDGGGAFVTKQVAADNGIRQTKYDIHGDVRVLVDELGREVEQVFDKMGRLTERKELRQKYVTGSTTMLYANDDFTDSYRYDGLGQRTQHWNNFLTSGNKETTDYDVQGRVISTRAFGGDVTTTAYTWDATIAASGMGVITGGWTELVKYHEGTTFTGKQSTEKTDLVGRVTWKSDLGGHVITYAYDIAGRQTSSTMGGLTATFTYFNTGLIKTNGGPNGTATYSYDAAGNRLTEVLVTGGVTIKNQSATYDAMGRLKTWTEAGTVKSPAASTTHSYDAVGNIRRTQTSQARLNATGGVTTPETRDYWFAFDSMNRLVVDKGMLVGAVGGATTIIRARDEGTETSYNAAGERMTSRSKRMIWGSIGRPSNIPGEPGHIYYPEQRLGVSLETYTYDAAGRLTKVEEAASMVSGETDTAIYITEPTGPGQTRSELTYDLMGRLTSQKDYGGEEAIAPTFKGVSYSRDVSYNAKSQVTSDTVSTLKARQPTPLLTVYDTFKSVTTYTYGSGTSYALGSVVTQSAENTKLVAGTWSSDPSTLTTTVYAWYDGAVQDRIVHDSNTGDSHNPDPLDPDHFNTRLIYNGFGQLTGADVNDGVAKDVVYTLDETGQIIRRDERRSSAPSEAAPHEVFYRFAGRQMGMTGNDGTADVNYSSSVLGRSKYRDDPTSSTAGLFRDGTKTGTIAYADFTQSYDPYNTGYQGSAGGSYTVRQGDTLQGIAANLYGDANLWYKIAEANGVSANSALAEGQTLTLPVGITRNTHNADTFRPYDPTDAIGDLSPTTPKPPKKPKCGILGQILVAAIAIGVTVLTAGSSAPLTAQIGAAVLGSVVSQGFAVATGIQDKFSFKGVALAALSAGVAGGLSDIGAFDKLRIAAGSGGSATLNAAARGALSSAVTQGIATATGLQSKFDFAGVAAAGVSAGVGSALGGKLKPLSGEGSSQSLSNIAGHVGVGAARLLANAATRSAIKGNSFGDNIIAALPDIIAQTLGNMVAGGVARSPSSKNNSSTGQMAEAAIVAGAFDQDGFNTDLLSNSLSGFGSSPSLNLSLIGDDGLAAAAAYAGAMVSMGDGTTLSQIAASASGAGGDLGHITAAAHGIDVPLSAVASASATPLHFMRNGSVADRAAYIEAFLANPTIGLAGQSNDIQAWRGERQAALAMAEVTGLTTGTAANPMELRQLIAFYGQGAATPGGEAFFGAQLRVALATQDAMNAAANAIVDEGIVGTFGHTGLTFANGYIAAADMGYQFWKGDLSLPQAGLEGGVALAGIAITRGRMSGVAAKGVPSRVLTVEEAGTNLAQQIGKNRVSVMTPSGRMQIDLAGKPHFEKSLGREIPTPHVKFQELNVAPNGRTNLSPGTTREATMQDIRTARKIMERRGN